MTAMLRLLLPFALLTSLCAQGAPWWRGSWEDAQKEAQLRNVPILICINMDDEEACERALELYRSTEFRKLAERAILVVCSPSAHKERRVLVGRTTGSKAKYRFECQRFGRVDCALHRELELEVRQFLWGEEPEVKVPSHFVLLPDLTKTWEDMSDVPGASLLGSAIHKAQRKLGKGLSGTQCAKIRAALAKAHEAQKRNDFGLVAAGLGALAKDAAKTGFAAEVRVLEAWVKAKSDRRLETIRGLVKMGKSLPALSLLRRTRQELKGTPADRIFKKEEASIRRTKGGRAAARVLAKEDRARPDYEKARARDRKGEFLKAALLYARVVSKAPGSELSKLAARRLRGLLSDRDAGPLLQREFSKRALSKAKKLLKKDRKLGREALQKVIDQWPNTPAAKNARELLGG